MKHSLDKEGRICTRCGSTNPLETEECLGAYVASNISVLSQEVRDMSTPVQVPEVVLITKKTRDDLRHYNTEMRTLLKQLVEEASSLPLRTGRLYELSFNAHKLLVEQEERLVIK